MRLPDPGQMFQDRYHLHEVLGRGGFAAVYRAIDVKMWREVAIKVLAPDDDGYPPGVEERFMREARLIGAFRDPHTITMFDFGRADDGLLFMVFEYLAGKDLAATIEEQGPLPPQTVSSILTQLLGSLREAHDSGVLHRDIKPANVLVYNYMGDPHRVKLLDFGIATFVEGEGGGGVKLTSKGMVVGSPGFMAPERILGLEVGPPSDLYSLGLVAHEMILGTPAIVGNTKETIREQLSDVPVCVPKPARSDESLCLIVDRLTERDPAARFQTASEALDALHARRHAPAQPVADGAAAPAGLSFKTILLAGLVAGILVLLMLKGMTVFFKDPPPPPPTRFELPTRAEPREQEPPTHRIDAPNPVVTVDAGRRDPSPDMSPPPTSGCGEDAAWSGAKTLQIEFGRQWRNWFTYLPKDYDPSHKHPVLLVFHARLKDGRRVAEDLNLLKLADKRKFIVVAPNGTDGAMDWAAQDGKFAQQAVDETANIACVDRSRVYAIGTGAGADMVRTLSCQMPLSGIALISAGHTQGQELCPPVPLIRFSGDADRYLPIDGSPNCIGLKHLSLEETEEVWKSHNRCEGGRLKHSGNKHGRCVTWRCDSGFVSCRVKGGNELITTKPRPFDFPGCDGPRVKFRVAEAAWRFFSKSGRSLETEIPNRP